MGRPLLFLDVDGVLNPYGTIQHLGRFTAHHLFTDEEPVLVDPGLGVLINQLRDVFETVWATSWNDQANTLLAALIGISALPVARMPAPPFDPTAKIAVLDGYAQRRAAVWIDDVHPPEAHAWATGRGAPTLLLTVDPNVGLTSRIVRCALAWARRLP